MFSLFFLLFYLQLHNTNESRNTLSFAITNMFTNTFMMIYIFLFLGNTLSISFYMFLSCSMGCVVQHYKSPVDIWCTLELVYFEIYDTFWYPDLSLTSSNPSCISKGFYLNVEGLSWPTNLLILQLRTISIEAQLRVRVVAEPIVNLSHNIDQSDLITRVFYQKQ